MPGGAPGSTARAGSLAAPASFCRSRVLSRLFRRLFLRNLQDAFEAGKLLVFGNLAGMAEPTAFAAELDQLRRI